MTTIFNSVKFTFILLLTVSFTFYACNKEDEGEKAANDLIGTWAINDTDVELSVGGEDLVTHMVNNFGYSQMEAETAVSFFTTGIEAENQGTINLKENNTYTLTNSDGEENGTWSLSSDGNTLTIVFENETDNLTILSLSSSSMQLKVPTEQEQIDLDDDGVDETTVDIDMELGLSK
jgi:hypothetical protein